MNFHLVTILFESLFHIHHWLINNVLLVIVIWLYTLAGGLISRIFNFTSFMYIYIHFSLYCWIRWFCSEEHHWLLFSHNTFLCLLNSSERSFSNSRIQISLFYHRVSSGFLKSAVFSYLSTHNPSNYHIN